MISLSRVGLSSVALACMAAWGCGSSDASGGSSPGGVSCASSTNAADTDSAKSALASAGAGSCVVLTGGSYAGPLSVPAGVTITSSARATITGGSADVPAILLAEGAGLANVDVIDAPGIAIGVRGGKARLSNVHVSGAKKIAFAASCTGDTCASGLVEVLDATFEKSTVGVLVSGAHVLLKGGKSSEHASQSLASAMGVVASGGAKLEMDGFTVEKNQGPGIVIDGEGTTASIKDSTVSENGERGVWVQRVTGTIDQPSVRIEGTTMAKNKIVGLGSVEARGIIVIGGRIADTVAAPIVTNLDKPEQVGDGFGFFDKSSDVKVDGTILESNARAAGIVDGSDRGIIVIGGKVSAGASGLKVVVQNTTGAMVTVPAGDTSTSTTPLGISAPRLMLPPTAL